MDNGYGLLSFLYTLMLVMVLGCIPVLVITFMVKKMATSILRAIHTVTK